MSYIIADLICPQLGFVYVVVLLIQVVRDHAVYLLLYEGADVVEDGLACLGHLLIIYFLFIYLYDR